MVTTEQNYTLAPFYSIPGNRTRRTEIRLGFVGLVDSSPLFIASDLGIFKKYGLDVRLSREVGWATVRDKLLNEELDAAQVPCPMPFAITLGLQSNPSTCVSGMVISKGGNAIVLSEALWKRGVSDAESLKQDICNSRFFRKYVLATVYPYSSHTFLLRDWLTSAGIDPDQDVQIVTLPPNQMCRNLAAGTIDGFCAGEPWPSLAISQEIGWSPATSDDILPGHPEKLLMVKESFSIEHHQKHVALIASIIEASAFCDNSGNWRSVAKSASTRRRVNCPESIVYECLSPRFNYGMGRIEETPQFISFKTRSANLINYPDLDWVISRVQSNDGEFDATASAKLKQKVFKPEVYQEALSIID